jgi:hypothetical protein
MSQIKDAERRAADQQGGQAAKPTLVGAPRLFVADAGAIWGENPAMAAGIVRKLGLLAQQEDARVVVRGVQAEQRQMLVGAIAPDRLVVEEGASPADVGALAARAGVPTSACLALLAMPNATLPQGCTAFYVGPGAPSANAHATRLAGPAAAEDILALYGTALAQERAGFAFRAASQGQGAPNSAPFDAGILRGVVSSTARPPAPRPIAFTPLPERQALRELAGRAYARLRRNLLPNGAVVGSPARGQGPGEPNYWFFWQRDAAAVMGWIAGWHQQGCLGLELGDLDGPIARYLAFLAEIQRRGHLGTSRYSVEGEPILGYGNPQLDGPALAALTLAKMGDPARAFGPLRVYLDFLLTPEGQEPTMDPWEFVYGRIYNATLLRYRALLAGSAVAAGLGRTADAERYSDAARQMDGELAAFVDIPRGHLVATRDTPDPWYGAISGLDMSSVSAVLANWRPGSQAGTSASATGAALGGNLSSVAHPAVLATMKALEEAFADLYQVNRDWRAGGNAGWGMGRFPEDANDGLGSTGGNPWSFTTLWGAQFYYRLAQELGHALEGAGSGSALMLRDPRQVAFLNWAVGDDVLGQTRGGSVDAATWRTRLLPGLLARGDGYLGFAVAHIPENGGVTEQIDRDTGTPRGAPDLSWALAELIGTIQVREKTYGALEGGS